jgi:hypothetical protein
MDTSGFKKLKQPAFYNPKVLCLFVIFVKQLVLFRQFLAEHLVSFKSYGSL